MIEALLGEPRSKASCDVRIEPHECAAARCQKIGDEGLGIVGIVGHHGPDNVAAPKRAECGKAGESSRAFEDGKAPDLGKMGNEICSIGAIGNAVELDDAWKIGGPGRAD